MALQTHINDIMMKRYSKVWLAGITLRLPAVLASCKSSCGSTQLRNHLLWGKIPHCTSDAP